MRVPTKAFLSAGSNLGDRRSILQSALAALREAGAVPVQISSCFETEPVGFLGQPWFLNLALEIQTLSTPIELLEICQAIETAQGRIRPFLNGPRTLDLDILLYGDLIMNDTRLQIPHPRMADRRFVLVPLEQIAPGLLHPVLGRSIRSLLESCPDSSTVRICPGGESL
jgi:2-amino-4-hydroxy-6-hydroxymethyldihydropteridine diphosphokinase